MPRRPRQEEAGAIHHVFARGVAKRAIYRDARDRERYLTMLAHAVRRHRWRCLAYCLMGNHAHLLLQTPEPNMGVGMRSLHGDYAAAFNDRHGLSGHVFQGRYGSVRVTSDAQLWVTAAYIALNPVVAGLCDQARAWPWSSHHHLAHGTEPAWLASGQLLEYLGGAFGGDPLRRYAAFVDGAAHNDDGAPTREPRAPRDELAAA